METQICLFDAQVWYSFYFTLGYFQNLSKVSKSFPKFLENIHLFATLILPYLVCSLYVCWSVFMCEKTPKLNIFFT